MILAVLHFGIVLVTILVVDVYSSCLFPKTCPCGASGKDYTRCYNTIIEQYSCERWANCQTCDSNNELCVTCPPGRSGPTCKDASCPFLKRPKNGVIQCSYDSTSVRSCTATCFPGYRFENHRLAEEITLNCEQNVWKPRQNIPDCKQVKVQTESSCKHPGVVENGIIQDFESDTEQFPIGTELRFLCREGYRIHGPEAIYCLLNFSWSDAPPVCISLATTASPSKSQPSCKHPGTVENGFIVNDEPEIQSFPLGSELRFQCNEGHEMIGAKAIHCLHSFNQGGYWSDVPPFCRYAVKTTTPQTISAIYCKHPGAVENGVTENYPLETERFPVGAALKFQCREGFELVGPTKLYCKRNGEWSQGPPNCRFIPKILVVSCVHPGMVENGRFEGDISKSSFPVGTALKIHCSPGTEIEGPMVIFCQHTGQWSQAPPICKSILQQRLEETVKPGQSPCTHPGTIENGVNEFSGPKVQVYLAGSEIKFKCREGYALDGPNTLRCLNNGEWSSTPPTCRPIKKIPDCGRVFQDVYKQTGKYTRSDWPWTVGISTVGEDDVEKMFCGGALLNSKTVLTAAHCATSFRNINLHFGHRRQSVTGDPVPEQVRTIQISRVFIHPEYDDERHTNDIALMKFEPHIYYNNRTQAVCLPTPILSSSGSNLFPGTKAIVTGYGLQFAANLSSAPKFLMDELLVQNEGECEEVCRGQGLVSCNPGTFCAGYPRNANECVYGGSPLVVFHPEKNRYTLEGLVTRAESTRNRWNGRCKRPESYTTITNVTDFMPFIMKYLE
ncbi:unnamed protein product [Larinioides sclopetarius]|uniref:Uncharacterized protein n=1 Tax=Larinioides sclopetarius TaxID=280406 RepID=A0AAV2A372_9ARAC